MLALLTIARPKTSASDEGFSLLEMLTVLFIIGTAAALVTPNLPLMLDRLTFAADRGTLIRNINALPYAALKANQDLLLVSTQHDRERPDDGQLSQDIQQETIAMRAHPAPATAMARLEMPDGWEIQVPNPILYKSTGFCGGGAISAMAGRVQYDFELSPPYCQISN